MKKFAAILHTVLLISIASFAYSQSLADLAKKERDRREEIENGTKVITNEEVTRYQDGAVTTGPSSSESGPEADSRARDSEGAKEAQSSSTEPESDEPVDFQGRPESFWRTTMVEARQKVKDLENEANVLVLKLNDLQMQFYREDDGFRREGIQREINKTFYEQDLNKENLANAKDALRDLEKEARRSGALPGWIEP